jgi:hypothetical protein
MAGARQGNEKNGPAQAGPEPALIEKFLGKVALAMEPPAGVPKA